jgi:hypothetical protein
VNWECLTQNPNAIHLLEQHLDKIKINFHYVAMNPDAVHLFAPLNKESMRANCKAFAEELAEHVFHPLRVQRLANQCGLYKDKYLEQF